MKITLATPENLDAIMEMYNSCVQGMLALGIDQWDESYPNRTIIEHEYKLQNKLIKVSMAYPLA